MDYFSWFDLERKYNVNQSALRKAFLNKSREVHPDRDADNDQDNAAFNNKAYTTLKDDYLRLHYLLSLENVLEADEKYELPADFLMQMLEFNMAIEEAKDEDDEAGIKALKEEVAQIEKAEQTKVFELLERLGYEKLSQTEYEQLRKFYYVRKYLLRIEENIATFATR